MIQEWKADVRRPVLGISEKGVQLSGCLVLLHLFVHHVKRRD